VKESRALYDLVKTQGRDGALGIVQGEHALGLIEFLQEHGSVDPPDTGGVGEP
jgi:hypothetical protein